MVLEFLRSLIYKFQNIVLSHSVIDDSPLNLSLSTVSCDVPLPTLELELPSRAQPFRKDAAPDGCFTVVPTCYEIQNASSSRLKDDFRTPP